MKHHCKSIPNENYLNELIKYETNKFPEKVNLNYYRNEVLDPSFAKSIINILFLIHPLQKVI